MISFRNIFNQLPDSLKERIYFLKNIPQRADYHPEGNTLKHVITVCKRAIKYGDIDQVIAALFHDIGKDVTFKMINGRPTAYGHEFVSARLVDEYSTWIKEQGANPEKVKFIVENHMKVKFLDKMRPFKVLALQSSPYFDDLIQFNQFDRGGLDI